MPLWSDNFNRADGPLGNDWVLTSGAPTISSNAVVSAGAYYIQAGPISAPGSAMAEVSIDYSTAPTGGPGPAVKMDATGYNLYMTAVTRAGGVDTVYLYRRTNQSYVSLGTYVCPSALTGAHILRITYAGGVVTAFLDGSQIIQASHSGNAANTGVGVVSTVANTGFDSFSGSGDGSKVLIVTPSVVGTEDGDVQLSLLATSTGWTPGTPGSPSFTANAGALSAQVIDSTTNARVIFSPPNTPQVVTIADPANGISDTVTVVEGVYQGGGASGASGLSEAAVGWLEAQAAHGGLVIADNDEAEGEVEGILIKNAFGELLLGKRKAVGEAPYPDYLTAVLADLYARLWGGEEWQEASFAESGTNAVKTDLLALLAKWDTISPPTQYSILDVLTLLGGVPLASHQDILDAISNIVVDNSEVIDAIEAAQGDPLATIKAVLDSIFVLGGSEANYTLATVKTWVEAVRGTNNPTIRDVLNKLGTSGNTIEARIDALSDLIVTQGTLQGMLDILLAAVTGGAGITIASATDDIIDAIDGIPTATPTPLPMWPGLANVTLGDSVALSDGLVVDGPMHGLLFTITGHPTGAGKYEFGDVDSWQHTGGVIFCSDNGDYERAESFGLERQILVPRTMEQAASAVIRLNTAWSGTVVPWTRTT